MYPSYPPGDTHSSSSSSPSPPPTHSFTHHRRSRQLHNARARAARGTTNPTLAQKEHTRSRSPSPQATLSCLKCSRMSRRVRTFLATPSRTIPIALMLFGTAYFLLFDTRTHLILLCASLGSMLLLVSGLLVISNAGGLLAFLSPTTQHMLLDYNLLELIKISWHSRTLQDIMSLVIFPLSRSERKRIIERLPSKLSAVLTRRGIVHLLPKPAKRLVGGGSVQTPGAVAADAREDTVLVERVRESLLSSSSQPNLAMLDTSLPSGRASPSGSPISSGGGGGFNRSRSMTALPEAADAAAEEAEECDDSELVEEEIPAQAPSRPRRRHRAAESKEDAEDHDSTRSNGVWFREDIDSVTVASIASTSSSSSGSSTSSSASASSSASSSSGSSTPDLSEADVRNYDECTPSPAHLYFSSREQIAAMQYPLIHGGSIGSAIAGSSASSSSTGASYRAPLSTFLPLPSSIDDLNFSNLLDRQIREHAKEGMKNMGKAVLESVSETAEAYWTELKQYVPPSILPYCTWQHGKVVLPLGSGLIFAQLTFRSARFRSLLLRATRLGFDAGVLVTALYAAVTAYRELTVHMQTPRLHPVGSPRHSPQPSSGNISPEPVALLPSYALYRRVHALSSSSQSSAVIRSFHAIRIFFSWLSMRYRASGTLRQSTLILMVWFAWLARNTSIVQNQKERIVEKIKRVVQHGEL